MLGAKLAIEPDGMQRIIDALARQGYRVVGPTVRDGAIVYDTVAGLDELPLGWTDQQDGDRYRLERRGRGAVRLCRRDTQVSPSSSASAVGRIITKIAPPSGLGWAPDSRHR
jgi:hypothetical protein